MNGNYNENSYEAGKVIVALNKRCPPIATPAYFNSSILDGIEFDEIEVLFQPQTLTNETDISTVILVYLRSSTKQAVIDAIEKLTRNPCVVFAEPDYYTYLHTIPNDPYFRFLWGMQEINSPLAWNYTTGNANVVVGVVDSGIDNNHPDIASNMWIAPRGQGLHGRDFTNNSANSMDFTGHGTHVAGTIGAIGNNSVGVTGVCWNVKLASLKIGNAFFDVASAIKAIDYANKNRIPILNNSWGSTHYSLSLKYAIDQYNGLFIVSAGNSGTNNDILHIYPASYDSNNIISVAATDSRRGLASFSNYGATSVDIAAPGSEILSSSLYGRYSYMNGTSMAAPHVAGAAALLKGYMPRLTTMGLKNIILSSVDRRPYIYGRVLSGGTLNVSRMINMATRIYGFQYIN